MWSEGHTADKPDAADLSPQRRVPDNGPLLCRFTSEAALLGLRGFRLWGLQVKGLGAGELSHTCLIDVLGGCGLWRA